MLEEQAAVETGGMRTIRCPASFKIESELEGVSAARPTEVVSNVKPRVALVIGQAILSVKIGAVGYEIKKCLGQDIVGVGPWVELAEREASLGAVDGVKVRRGSTPEQVGGRAQLLLPHKADVKFVHHGRIYHVRPVDLYCIRGLFVMVFEDWKIVSKAEYAAPEGPGIDPPAAPSHRESILLRGVIVEFERLQSLGDFADVLPLIIVGQARI